MIRLAETLLRKVITFKDVLRRMPDTQNGYYFVADGEYNAMRWAAPNTEEKLTHAAIE